MSNQIIYPQLNHFKNIGIKDYSQHLKMKLSKKPEIRIVFFGSNHLSALVLKKLINFCQKPRCHPGGVALNPITPHHDNDTSYSIQTVVTQPDKKTGRKQKIAPSEVAQFAESLEIPVLKPEKLDEEFIKNHLSFLDSDLFIVAVYGKILPQKLLDIPQYGALNIHPSLLPKYRGPSPIQKAILNGDKVSGVTIIKMDEKMDHGPIVATKKIILSQKDNFDNLSKKMFKEGADLLVKIIPDYLLGKITPLLQTDAISKASLLINQNVATYCNIIKKEDGYFDINNPPSSEKLDRMIRAYYPWPTAWTRWPFDFAQGKNGKIVKFMPDNIVQIEGKKPVKLEEFLRGYPSFPIKSLA